ncbi:DUF2281 domain-containing protein [bacterium]|nr:DUF2281 domain-containing protein [bacterium]
MPEKLAQVYETLSCVQQQELLDFAYFLAMKSKNSQSGSRTNFGGLRDRINFVAADFDAPVNDFQEYME